MAKPNYHHARKQKEQARKSRQLRKEQRKTDRSKPDTDGSGDPVQLAADAPVTPGTSGG